VAVEGGKGPAVGLIEEGEYRQIQFEATSVVVKARIYYPETVCPQW
jgi:hypothetical protein